MDFGNGDYDQIIAYVKRSADVNINLYVEIYLDEVSEDNLLANIWTGLQMTNTTPLAANIKSVTGEHKIIAKWVGGISNFRKETFGRNRLSAE